MKEYQRQKGNKYILPRELYNQTIWQIRDYHRLKDQAEAILEASPEPSDGQPKGNGTGNTVENKAIKRERLLCTIQIIEESKASIPIEYREGVWNNVLFRQPFPEDADRSTYGRYKSKFVYEVAKKLFLL